MFIVVWFDGDHCWPYCEDANIPGSLCVSTWGDDVAMFASRQLAMKSIAISRAQAKLDKLRGGIFNDDFIGTHKAIKIVKLTEYKESES